MSDDEGSGSRGRGKRSAPSRSYTVSLEGIDLKTVEGQEELIVRCQRALAEAPLNGLDLKIVIALKDSIKVKKDIDTLKLYVELKDEIERMKDERRKVKSELMTAPTQPS